MEIFSYNLFLMIFQTTKCFYKNKLKLIIFNIINVHKYIQIYNYYNNILILKDIF